ncbi:hypothetical protein IAT38_002649 [Cryptococcus sp. DSM 104549]
MFTQAISTLALLAAATTSRAAPIPSEEAAPINITTPLNGTSSNTTDQSALSISWNFTCDAVFSDSVEVDVDSSNTSTPVGVAEPLDDDDSSSSSPSNNKTEWDDSNLEFNCSAPLNLTIILSSTSLNSTFTPLTITQNITSPAGTFNYTPSSSIPSGEYFLTFTDFGGPIIGYSDDFTVDEDDEGAGFAGGIVAFPSFGGGGGRAGSVSSGSSSSGSSSKGSSSSSSGSSKGSSSSSSGSSGSSGYRPGTVVGGGTGGRNAGSRRAGVPSVVLGLVGLVFVMGL